MKSFSPAITADKCYPRAKVILPQDSETAIPNALKARITVLKVGLPPRSILLTCAFLTPMRSANSSWVILAQGRFSVDERCFALPPSQIS